MANSLRAAIRDRSMAAIVIVDSAIERVSDNAAGEICNPRLSGREAEVTGYRMVFRRGWSRKDSVRMLRRDSSLRKSD